MSENSNPLRPTKQQIIRETILATACGGMALALSTVLSMVKLYAMPLGGSLTAASMLPLIFVALAFGPAWGIGICIVYGLIQFAIEPWFLTIFSFILDYPLAFGAIGLAGFLAAPRLARYAEKNVLHRVGLVSIPRIIVAIIIGMSARFFCHVLSGVIFYASSAPEGQSPWIFSAIYNGSFMLPELILTCIILIPLAAVFKPRHHILTDK